QWTTFSGSTFNQSGGAVDLSGFARADDSSFSATGGAMLTLSSLTSYASGTGDVDSFQASGTGSVLSIPKLTTFTEDTTETQSLAQIEAFGGGTISMPLLTTITGGAVQLESDGSASQLSVPSLSSFQGSSTSVSASSSLQVSGGASIDDPTLKTLNFVSLIL